MRTTLVLRPFWGVSGPLLLLPLLLGSQLACLEPEPLANPPPSADEPRFGLSAPEATVSIGPNANVDVRVHVDRYVDFAEDVSLSFQPVDGAPTIDGLITPNPSGHGLAWIRLTAGDITAASQHLATVTGVSQQIRQSTAFELSARVTNTLNGSLFTDGMPIDGGTVAVNGVDITAVAGAWTAQDALLPYAAIASLGGTELHLSALSQENPLIALPLGQRSLALIGGTVTAPAGIGIGDTVMVASSEGTLATFLADERGDYGGHIAWGYAGDLSTLIKAMRVRSTNGIPTEFVDQSQPRQFDAQAEVNIPGQNLALDEVVTTAQTSFSFNAGSFTTDLKAGVWSIFAGAHTFLWHTIAGDQTAISGESVRFPEDGGMLFVSGTNSAGATAFWAEPANLTEGGTTSVILPANNAVTLVTPQEATIVTNGTPVTLGWTIGDIQVSNVIVEITADSVNRTYVVDNTNTQVVAVDLPIDTTFTWKVTAIDGVGFSGDDFVRRASHFDLEARKSLARQTLRVFTSAEGTFSSGP